MVAAVYVNLRSYISYISGNRIKTLEIRLLRGFGGFSVLCKGFSSGVLLHIRQKDRSPPSYLTEGQKNMIPPSYLTGGQKEKEPKQYIRGNTACARACSLSKQSGERKARNKSAQGNALGIVRNQHSPRMGKRIIIPFTPFAILQGWAVILLPPSGAYPCCILSPPGRCPGLAYQCPFGA